MAAAARGQNGSVVEAYGRVWLLTIAAADWRAKGGRHIATIGPFAPLTAGPQLASYMVATTDANMDSAPHSHAGPEAFYVVEGSQCLETPAGAQNVKAGAGMFVAGGVPMKLYGAGKGTRRALVLVLHDAAQPTVIRNPDWQPQGLCLPH
jgi:quercetin dioxygenase-like cupin family protein